MERDVSVYCVTCVPNGKQYIGISVRGPANRWKRHVRDALVNNRNWLLQNAIRKYGAEQFTVETIYIASSYYEARIVERGIIAERGTLTPRGYNMTGGGEMIAKITFTPERLKQLGEQNRGRKASAETRAKMSAAHLGKKRSPQARANISAGKKGWKPSPELLQRWSQSRKGKAPSLEAREKISASLRGRKQDPEFVQRRIAAILSAPNKNRDKTHCAHGHAFTEENTYRHGRDRVCRTCIRARKAARRKAA